MYAYRQSGDASSVTLIADAHVLGRGCLHYIMIHTDLPRQDAARPRRRVRELARVRSAAPVRMVTPALPLSRATASGTPATDDDRDRPGERVLWERRGEAGGGDAAPPSAVLRTGHTRTMSSLSAPLGSLWNRGSRVPTPPRALLFPVPRCPLATGTAGWLLASARSAASPRKWRSTTRPVAAAPERRL